MNYITTRTKNNSKTSSSQAILKGLGEDGGLYLPESLPQISLETLKTMVAETYQEKAQRIFSLFLTDFSPAELESCISGAYNSQTFSSPKVTPLHKISPKSHVLELYHGPTAAFKDVALQILPRFLVTSARKNQDDKTYVILVATSGDTGKAALEGFKDVAGTKVLVFYPDQGVSNVQKLQMVTQEGDNLRVLAVKGNFDDTQNGVKELFSKEALAKKLAANNLTFSSANSINWGRLVPQIVYYFESYTALVEDSTIALGDPVNFCVPTGNFGNILAGYFARAMGLPINKLICAANENDVLTDFIKTGTYNRNRDFHKTISPSMDILISSNLERLLFLVSDSDAVLVKKLMDNLKKEGSYTIPKELHDKIKDVFWSEKVSDEETIKTIKETYEKDNYLIDTHTAVAYRVYQDYLEETNDQTPCIILSTASPYKFNQSVAKGIIPEETGLDEFALLDRVAAVTKTTIPPSLNHLEKKQVRFSQVISKEEMETALLDFLKL